MRRAEDSSKEADSPRHESLSKRLKFDTAVPGDRGDCEKESATQGSE